MDFAEFGPVPHGENPNPFRRSGGTRCSIALGILDSPLIEHSSLDPTRIDVWLPTFRYINPAIGHLPQCPPLPVF
jgi:hypothetical protein